MVLHCQIEDLSKDIKVDIIVSEWMGFYLLHEGMLSSVIHARDAYLKEDGYLFPEQCILYSAPCQLPSFNEDWNNLFGVKMKSFGKDYRKNFQGKPAIRSVSPEDLLSDGSEFLKINLNSVKIEELEKITRTQVFGCKKNGIYQGVCLWFDCIFPHFSDSSKVVLSTKPGNPDTHWKQTAIVLPMELAVETGDAVAWELSLNRVPNNVRSYTILLTMLDPDEETHPIPCDCNRPKCVVIKTYLAQLSSDSHSEDGHSSSSDSDSIEPN